MRPNRAVLLAALATLAAACDTARTTTADEAHAAVAACVRCHGDGSRIAANPLELAAPPSGPRGGSLPTDLDVGAHQAHLSGKAFSRGVVCTECHAVPGASHPTGAVEFEFSARGNLAPTTHYDPSAHTCASSYCHDPLGTGRATPAWNAPGSVTCGSCHDLPPAPSTGHPAVSSALTGCAACHPATMKADGTLDVAGGKHVNGLVDSTGHGDFTSPAVHGPKALDALGGVSGALDCKSCHGADYGGGFGPSCNACHAAAGWGAWQTSCSFCHGLRSAATKAGYDVATEPTWAAPPDDVAGRLTGTNVPTRTGAHQAHLTGVARSGTAFAQPFRCETCHAVPADAGHVRGSTARAVVALSGAGQGSFPAALGSYDPTSGTCTTYCHGAAASPAWSGSVTCGTCHGVPPDPSTGHPAVSSALTGCAGCHPDTMNADGTLNVAGGKHVDGRVDAVGHGDFTSPAVHGPQALDFIGHVPGALDCASCHGQDYGGGVGPSCNACHASSGWTAWQTNCSFCHGLRSAATMAGYAVSAQPTWAAPPDDIAGRLGGTPDPARTGAHQVHLAGVSSDGKSYAPPFRCETCHAVPTDLSHVDGAAARAVVNLAGAGQATLPSALGAYDAASGTCTAYCHGSTLLASTGAAPVAPAWRGSALACADACHGAPPPTGRLVLYAATGTPVSTPTHLVHDSEGIVCGKCHAATADPSTDATLLPDVSRHVNGTKDVVFSDGGTWDAVGGTCTTVPACHGSTVMHWR